MTTLPPIKTSLNALAAGIAFAAIPVLLFAQWPNYPTTGVPRTDTGQPILDAPAPKAPDGHPDLSGIWAFRGGLGQQPGQKGKAAPPPPVAADGVPLANFKNIGAGFKEGLPLLPSAAEMLKARRAENSKDNPDAHCLPLGLMQLHTHPQPRKIIQTPGLVVILYEAQAGIRQIFTDGRPLPPKDVEPWWYAYSIGKWDGDTLVVESNGFRDDVWLDIDGSPLTNTGKMTERFRRVNYGTLRDRHHIRGSQGVHQAVHRAGSAAHHARHRFDRVYLRRKRSKRPPPGGKIDVPGAEEAGSSRTVLLDEGLRGSDKFDARPEGRLAGSLCLPDAAG